MADGASIALFSLHQRDAGLDLRERLVRELPPPAPDLFVLATCHRIEIALALHGAADARAALADRLGTAPPVEGTLRTGTEAARHLLRVACGLDSVVRGEGQILGQLRRTFDAARSDGLDPALALLARRAIELARELRRTTPLGGVERSLGSLAVDAALEGVADPRNAAVLIIGAGEMGKLALRALAQRAGRVFIANRDAERAAALAAAHGAVALPLADVDAALDQVAAVIAAADTHGTVLTADRLRRRAVRGPLTIVDLAVPRSVEQGARGLSAIRYIDVDGLAGAGSQLSPDVVAELERRCAATAEAIVRELETRRAAPTIRALHERAEEIRRRQLDRALARLAHLSPRDRQVVESLSEGLAHALLHEPTVRLREEPERERAARDLFAL
ncbi:MAG TPA: NAD(P)-binding domain-containing protein [Candidatus Limnocylindria bacterium]|nr:NAD(P)-binding domain-containing protein [Candidatus Limnocylindria bacterium]